MEASYCVSCHQVALLTHIDQSRPQTAKDVTKVYKSSIIQTMVSFIVIWTITETLTLVLILGLFRLTSLTSHKDNLKKNLKQKSQDWKVSYDQCTAFINMHFSNQGDWNQKRQCFKHLSLYKMYFAAL